eukprot:1160185-Pelagomonas_calceolata.AAC.4
MTGRARKDAERCRTKYQRSFPCMGLNQTLISKAKNECSVALSESALTPFCRRIAFEASSPHPLHKTRPPLN